MGKISLFKALSSKTRIKIIKLLLKKDMHISAIAREIGISVPVALRHVNILENVGLLDKKIIGNVHVLSIKPEKIDHLMEPLMDSVQVEIEQAESLDNALRQLPFITLKKLGKNEFISSIDGREGYFLYEVEGEHPDIPVNEYTPTHDVTIIRSKMISVKQKRIFVKIKENKIKKD